jgi:2-polyprenyl-3-methyl-5-hydroxy-6-metoxy-1,4-benzoquinol methylase
MLAKKPLPPDFAAWNVRHGAPEGRAWWDRILHSRLRERALAARFALPGFVMRRIGPFGFQTNSETRAFEYPWCHRAASIRPGLRVVELGAGASGFQFVLAAEGCDVTAVDPLIEPPGGEHWTFTEQDFQRVNRAFGGRVRFHKKFLQDVALPEGSIDRVFCVSVIEHIPDAPAMELVKEIRRILKPGGLLIATIDLFLDCAPFTNKASNDWGWNTDVRRLVETSGLTMTVGDSAELCGYTCFEPRAILARRNEFISANDVCVQCVVLRKD